MTDLPQRDVDKVVAWTAAAVPEAMHDQYRWEVERRGARLTIVEHRAPWGAGTGWSKRAMAQLRYDGTAWSLWWQRANGQWLRYQWRRPIRTVTAALRAIEANDDGCFD